MLGLLFVIFAISALGPLKDRVGALTISNYKLIGPGNSCPVLSAPGPVAEIAKLCSNTLSCSGMLVDGDTATPCANEINDGSVTDKTAVTVVDNVQDWKKKYVYYRKNVNDGIVVPSGNGPLGVVDGYTYAGRTAPCNFVEFSDDHELCRQDPRCMGMGVLPDGRQVFCGNKPSESGEMYFYHKNGV